VTSRSLGSALADTSVFIARENGRAFDAGLVPDRLALSVITIGELRAGVLAAADLETRERRLRTLTTAMSFDPVPIDDMVATQWATLRVMLRDANLRMPVNDSWIAATALAHGLAVVTQDDDFPEVGGLRIIRV
jgi:predicted nucleic acid-binding protein